MRRVGRRAPRTRSTATVAGLALVVGLAACRSTQPELERIAELEASASADRAAGDWSSAVERWSELCDAAPDFAPRFHRGRAEGLLALGDPRAALDALEEGLAHFPDDVDLRRARGRLLVDLGFRRAAQADLAFVASVIGDDAEAWREVATVHAMLFESTAAADAFDRALQIADLRHRDLVRAARSNADAQRVARALELWRCAIEQVPDDELLLVEAVAWGRATIEDGRSATGLAPTLADWSARLAHHEATGRARRDRQRSERTVTAIVAATRPLRVALAAHLAPWWAASHVERPAVTLVAVERASGPRSLDETWLGPPPE